MNSSTPSPQLESDFEVRADHVEEGLLRTGTVTSDWFDNIEKSLLDKTLTLLVGPRGCGKTHMMRFTWLKCVEDLQSPLALYVSFNRYLRLEPLLKTRSDAGSLFHTWVLALLLISLSEVDRRLSPDKNESQSRIAGLDLDQIESMVTRLERGLNLSTDAEVFSQQISIEFLIRSIQEVARKHHRKRTILLLDDAALTLAPEFMIEFFDIVRALKRADIAPKCSVYPGSTEYGSRFHAFHEGNIVPVWLSVDHPNYIGIMKEIGEKRYPAGVANVSEEVAQLLMFTAFGSPRAYLSLLRSLLSSSDSHNQRSLNKVIQEHRDSKIDEYLSLKKKVPRFEIVVQTGATFFSNVIEQIRKQNEELLEARAEKQLLLGIEASELSALTSRMIQFLIEAGLLFEHSEVSHGSDRVYKRYTPHLAALIAARSFSPKTRGGSPSATLEFLARKSTKHPVRKKLSSLLSKDALLEMKLNLPECQNCGNPRVAEEQKFCMNCGARLTDPSTFTTLMNAPIGDVPNLTVWQRSKVKEHGINFVRDLLSYQDPGSELRKIHRVGKSRAQQIVSGVDAFVEEFLS